MISVGSRKILALVIALALAAIITFPTSAQATTVTDKVVVPAEYINFACNGEIIFLSGEFLIISHTTIDPGGRLHAQLTFRQRNIRGVGSVTGTQYKEVGGFASHTKLAADDTLLNVTDAAMFNLVSQGGSDNLQVKITFHITVNANGEVTARIIDFSRECVG